MLAKKVDDPVIRPVVFGTRKLEDIVGARGIPASPRNPSDDLREFLLQHSFCHSPRYNRRISAEIIYYDSNSKFFQK